MTNKSETDLSLNGTAGGPAETGRSVPVNPDPAGLAQDSAMAGIGIGAIA
ncbi:MAG: hypothetical protein QOJ04_4896, partial [Caballeronia sp.]|nr:hypothetical protein [Caballeronia sp.]